MTLVRVRVQYTVPYRPANGTSTYQYFRYEWSLMEIDVQCRRTRAAHTALVVDKQLKVTVRVQQRSRNHSAAITALPTAALAIFASSRFDIALPLLPGQSVQPATAVVRVTRTTVRVHTACATCHATDRVQDTQHASITTTP